jgi:glyceraldehyde-3-phosphate dehydrogenase/erythrose-4-phosphate dehydrogenase
MNAKSAKLEPKWSVTIDTERDQKVLSCRSCHHNCVVTVAHANNDMFGRVPKFVCSLGGHPKVWVP